MNTDNVTVNARDKKNTMKLTVAVTVHEELNMTVGLPTRWNIGVQCNEKEKRKGKLCKM